MDGVLNTKHVDWITRLKTIRGKLLRDYAEENSCLIFGPDSQPPTHIVAWLLPMSWTSWWPRTSYSRCIWLPAPHQVRTTSQFSLTLRVAHYFNTNRIALTSGALSGPTAKLTWTNQFRSKRNCTTRWQSTRALRTSPAPFWRLWQRRPRDDPGPPIPAGIQGEIRLKSRLQRQWQITSDPSLIAEVGDPPAQQVEKRPVERYTRIPWSWRPIALEDDQTGDESSYSINPWSPQGESLSWTLRKPKTLQTIWRPSFSRWPIFRSGQLLS